MWDGTSADSHILSLIPVSNAVLYVHLHPVSVHFVNVLYNCVLLPSLLLY